MTTQQQVDPSMVARAEREIRNFGKMFKGLMAVADTMEEMGGLDRMIFDLETRIAALKQEEAAQIARVDELKAANAQGEAAIVHAKRRVNELTAEMNNAIETRDAAVAETAKAEKDLVTTRAEIAGIFERAGA